MAIIIVLINIPNWSAFFHALYEAYIQKNCEIKLKTSPYCGIFNDVKRKPRTVKTTRHTWAILLKVKFFFILYVPQKQYS